MDKSTETESVPNLWISLSILVKKDDYLVKGQCSVQVKTANDLGGTEHFKVSAANYNRYGGNQHSKGTGGA